MTPGSPDYTRSMQWLARARRVTPAGSQTMSKSATRFVEGAYPCMVRSGNGALVRDVDGREYVDWIAGLGVLTLGHRHPAVVEAVERQLHDGILYSLPHTVECEVAEKLVAVVPCAARDGMVRWVKTGSEACSAAIRIARAATGRDVIVVASGGYHGWHDWFLASLPEHPGVPDGMAAWIRTFRYGDVESFERVIEEIGADRVAAVMLEPALSVPPTSGFLEHLRRRTHETGALLIFDELLSGFRLALAGGQEFFGVVPDLASFGKALGGGLPLACVVGPGRLMEHGVLVSSTFGGDALGLAAAGAVLDVYRRTPVIEALWSAGRFVCDVVSRWGDRLPIQVAGSPVRPIIRFKHPDERLLLQLLLQEAAGGGVLVHPDGLYTSAAFEPADLRRTEEALTCSLEVVRTAIEDPARLSEQLRGLPGSGQFARDEHIRR